jgi:hypothetical protein
LNNRPGVKSLPDQYLAQRDAVDHEMSRTELLIDARTLGKRVGKT